MDGEFDFGAFFARRPGESAFDNLATSLSKAIEVKDVYTAYHCERVANFSRALGEKVGISGVELLTMAGQLHDVGKIAIAEGILSKRGPLDELEWAVIKTHPVVAERILGSLGFSAYVVSAVRHHHERWDGRGYPDGLVGAAIPIGARILALSDAFDAMTSDRPFRKAFSFKEAVMRMEEGLGTQFDPLLCETFLNLLVGNGQI